MQEKTVEIKDNVKKEFGRYKHVIAVSGAITCAMYIGREIGFAKGYCKCLCDVINASSGNTGN